MAPIPATIGPGKLSILCADSRPVILMRWSSWTSWTVVISHACQKSGLVDLGGLRGPESRRNACQEVYSIDNNQGKDRDNDKQPAGRVEPVPKTGAEQTIRLMGKILTVGKGNKQDQGCARTTTINLTLFF